MRELIFLTCDMNATSKARKWAVGALDHAGVPSRVAQTAAKRLADGFKSAVEALQGARGDADPAQVMLVLSDESGELSFEMVAEARKSRGAMLAQGLGGSVWSVIDRRAVGDGVTCLRMPATA